MRLLGKKTDSYSALAVTAWEREMVILWLFLFITLVITFLAVDHVRKVNTERLILRMRRYKVWL
jgi:hypothetical protein